MITEVKNDFLADIGLGEDYRSVSLELLEHGESKYLKDLRINLKNVLESEHLSRKETALIALAVGVNEGNEVLIKYFVKLAGEHGASDAETGEAVACASLLSTNNVFYRFRHFTRKEKYNQLQVRIKMSIMLNPILGKEFFELVSLAISAVNGCEMCVKSHEESVLHAGGAEERIFDAVRIAAVVTGVAKIIK